MKATLIKDITEANTTPAISLAVQALAYLCDQRDEGTDVKVLKGKRSLPRTTL